MAYCSKNVCWRSRQFGTNAEVSARHFGTGAKLSGHFGTSLMVPKCLGSEVSWVWSVLTPYRECRDREIRAWSVSADAWRPALAGYSSGSTVRACCDSPFLSLTPSSMVPRQLLCASLQSSWLPASAICQMLSTVSSVSSPQHFWNPCIFCRQTKKMEFTAWSFARSSCWLWTI